MNTFFKKNIEDKLQGEFQTDGKFFLFTIKELGLSGKGLSAKEAYDDLMDTWKKSHKLLGSDNISIYQNHQLCKQPLALKNHSILYSSQCTQL